MSIRRRLRIRNRLRSVAHRIWPPKPKPVILMYHRITDDPVDHWRLAVSPARFEEQLRVLRRTRYPLPLMDFVSRLMAGTLPPNAVALTFDDGYVDNLVAAKPRLAAADVPATVFLATGYIDSPERFWWDEIARLFFLESGPQTFELVIRGKSMRFDFGTEPLAREDGTTPGHSLPKRRAALWALREALRPLDDEDQQPIMAELRSIFGGRDCRASLGRAMTGDEVRSLVKDGLVTIGAHTVTHPILAGRETATCRREILQSKSSCEALIGTPVLSFAYPYGDFDAETRDAVKAAGITVACSTLRGPALATSDILALPRIGVSNWNDDEFEQALRSASAAA